MAKKVFGVGIKGNLPTRYGSDRIKSYDIWATMIQRCYDSKYHARKSTYKDCTVCDEWLYYPTFKLWFDEHYKNEHHLDKDIVQGGNKVYCPEYCTFIPKGLNSMFRSPPVRDLPTGVYKVGNRFRVTIKTYNKTNNIGTFGTPEAASIVYNSHRQKYVREVVDSFRQNGLISEEVYTTIINNKSIMRGI